MMAWLDDRAWCHPKLVNLSDRAFRVYVNGISYSSGMGLRGILTSQQQKIIGSTPFVRQSLLKEGLWDERGGSIYIHDWEEHNAKRDARRAADRERKRQERADDPDGWVTRTGDWKRTRRAVFQRDRGICIDCKNADENWHADHVPDRAVLRARGDDPFDLQFIQTRCRSCHARRHRQLALALKGQIGTEPTEQTDIKSDRLHAEGSERVKVVKREANASLGRDEIWDALVVELGEPKTKTERGRLNAAVKELREAEASPDDIRSRCRQYRLKWPDMALTPQALTKHWTLFESKKRAELRPREEVFIVPLTDEERAENVERMRALARGIGAKV